MGKEEEYKAIIKQNLNNTLFNGFVPELGVHKSGKVRDVHFTSPDAESSIVMVASDRISCFDHILSRQIPFKGAILNLFAQWAFDNTKDIVDNAVIKSPHDNVIIQKKMDKLSFEFVVRGYVWGSMAADYEDGKREFCGIKLSDNLLRYQKLDEPLFTPATKAEDGDHDVNISFEYMADKIGTKLATELKDVSIKLYERASKLAKEKGFIFIDTKYEFGLDQKKKIYLIDEANTPDSSRYCTIEEYKKYKDIKTEMDSGSYKDVTELLKKKPKLKIKELSKQFARDVLVEKGFSYGASGAPPDLSDEDVIEVSYRYIDLYETLTGKNFNFPQTNVRLDLIEKLKDTGYIKGGLVAIVAGSDSDMPHIEKIKSELDKYGIPSHVRICSAHKQPSTCEKIIKHYNESLEPIVIVAVAGGTDALSGVASFHSVYPVISCPPDSKEYTSCINNPSGSSNSLILKPANVARHVAQILGYANNKLNDALLKGNAEKIAKLEQADRGV
ncbi:MAG: AIR carboxylase family protein [Nanoarchaeota archaeon]|nr:AIR carboxylase family protein [Nanoarchaeota archaeon]MBU1269984.1 AIR carboxylase family protein [Nanoarchaeota archaeon]MBU1604406.1 AIR carboxylase family protein [Nanoarchaeota archaeon]MBU2442582.1 AIR carboxylase family protein [Nanoarchaeota archaeon]